MDTTLNIIITHGGLAHALQKVVSNLISPAPVFHCFSNQKSSFETIENEILGLMESEQPSHTMIFVDLMGGSCWLAANRIRQKAKKVSFATGVNVPMLVSYCMNYRRLPWDELMVKIEEDAKKGVLIK